MLVLWKRRGLFTRNSSLAKDYTTNPQAHKFDNELDVRFHHTLHTLVMLFDFLATVVAKQFKVFMTLRQMQVGLIVVDKRERLEA